MILFMAVTIAIYFILSVIIYSILSKDRIKPRLKIQLFGIWFIGAFILIGYYIKAVIQIHG